MLHLRIDPDLGAVVETFLRLRADVHIILLINAHVESHMFIIAAKICTKTTALLHKKHRYTHGPITAIIVRVFASLCSLYHTVS